MSEELLKESISEAAEYHGFILPPECVNDIAHAVDMCREITSYTTGGHDPKQEKIKQLEAELERERRRVTCDFCNGSGWDDGPHHSATCTKCNGSGVIYP